MLLIRGGIWCRRCWLGGEKGVRGGQLFNWSSRLIWEYSGYKFNMSGVVKLLGFGVITLVSQF